MSKANRKPDPSTAMSVREIVATASVLFALTFIAFLVWSGFYTVREFEKAVVLRWGKFSDTVEPGLHFKIPWVEERILVDCSEHNLRLPWGIEEQAPRGSSATIDREEHENKLILTGDLYAAIVEWNVYWRVSDPKAFILKLNPDEVEETINAVSRSTMHRVVGDYSADEILTSKREEIALAALRELKQTIDSFECGIEIVDLQLQRASPPDRVKPAFDEVNASVQQRDKLISEARTERNKLIPMANAASDKLIREAEGYAARRRAEAEGEIEALLAKYQAYQQAPELTRNRLYLETMEKVLKNSGPKVILDENLKGLLPMLDLNEKD